jgi:hypothetical protein
VIGTFKTTWLPSTNLNITVIGDPPPADGLAASAEALAASCCFSASCCAPPDLGGEGLWWRLEPQMLHRCEIRSLSMVHALQHHFPGEFATSSLSAASS